MEKEIILRRLHAQANVGHILGAVAGSGLTAKLAVLGGVDIPRVRRAIVFPLVNLRAKYPLNGVRVF